MTDAIRVLYVDDEPFLLDIGKRFLEKSCIFSIFTCESADAALELLAKEPFDAIISDYQMPEMDGIQFLIEVRAHFGKVPFILFTGRGREEVVIQAINNGADFYLQKGGNPDAQFAELSHHILMIVAQRIAEKALKVSENRYRSLVENMHDCVAVYSAVADGEDFEILEFNHAAEKTEKITREEVIGHRLTEVFPGVQEFGILNILRRVWHTGVPESLPVSFYKDNRISGWRDNFIFKLPSGEIVASYSDETSRKQVEEELFSSNNKLTHLSSITRHDIYNQLLALDGFIEILHAKAPDPTLKDYFNQITKVSSGIAATIRFTKEYEQIGVKTPTWLDCRILVENAANEAPLGTILVKNDLAADIEVFADPLTARVFFNLIDNAVRYGGKITTIRFSFQGSGDDRTIVCEDDGVGIPVFEKKIIFDRGFGKNTGLGLAISREILDITGITIKETGEPGQGARFEMVVPNGAWRVVGKGD